MAATVTVLLPTGRRQNVKVTANTRILQVIEDACSKIGYNPDEYNLKHHRSILDPNQSVRYANLPNNCKLELVKADKARTESAVYIALQIESGERLQADFTPSTSLWALLEHWQSTHDSALNGQLTASSLAEDDKKTVHPVCIYLRQEVVGEAWLRATTLKSLGLTGGKAVIRLLHRAVDLPAPPSTPESKPARDLPTTRIQSPSQPPASTTQGQSTSVQRDDDQDEPMEVQRPDTKSSPGEGNKVNCDIVDGENVAVSKPHQNQLDSRIKLDHTSGQFKSSESAHTEPLEDGESTHSKLSTDGFASGISAGSEGARPKHPPPKERAMVHQEIQGAPLSQEIEQQANMMGASLAEAILKHRTDQQLAQLKESWASQTQSQPTFADFKFPERPSAQSQSFGLQQRTSKPAEPCDRQALVFNLDQGTSGSMAATRDVPDSFFEVTVDDVRKMMANQRLFMTSGTEQPLQTKAMREASERQKAQQYSKVAVRVHFPDRYILQGFFRSQEPVKALRDFVGSHLQDPETPFYLYTTPPRCVLTDESQSLFKAKLFPAAVVYFGSEVAVEHYLRSDLMREVTSFARATQEASTVVQGSTSVDTTQATSSANSRQSSSALSSGASTSKASAAASASGRQDPQGSAKRQASGEGAANSEKIPKWFKLGKR